MAIMGQRTAELERQKPVIEAARLWRDQCEVHKANHDALIAAVDAFTDPASKKS